MSMPWALFLNKVGYVEQPVGAFSCTAAIFSSSVCSPADSGNKGESMLERQQVPELAINVVNGALVLLKQCFLLLAPKAMEGGQSKCRLSQRRQQRRSVRRWRGQPFHHLAPALAQGRGGRVVSALVCAKARAVGCSDQRQAWRWCLALVVGPPEHK